MYDARGSELFEAICIQPEYYPTRTEAKILRAHAPEIAGATGPVTVIELGAGTSDKTRHLLSAYTQLDASPHYIAVDVSDSALRKARARIGRELPKVRVEAICGPYERAFSLLSDAERAMVVFLGSTLGNFNDEDLERFFSNMAVHLPTRNYLLLGVDLHKDTPKLEAAYNDAAGVTAEFTINLFARMNRELGTRIDLDTVEHQAHYNEREKQIEIYAHFTEAQQVDIAPLNETLELPAGTRVRTEISRKFTVEDLCQRLGRHGFQRRAVYSDDRNWFALVLFERAAL